MLFHLRSIVFLLIPLSFALTAHAEYIGPEVVASGAWGKADNQFVLEFGDSGDIFPTEFGVLSDGTVIIIDGKLKVYKDNSFLRAFEVDGNVYFCDSGIVVAKSIESDSDSKKTKGEKNRQSAFLTHQGKK